MVDSIAHASLNALPSGTGDSVFLGRVWDPDTAGPRVCFVQGGELVDITPLRPTVSAALEQPATLRELDTAQSNRFDLESVLVSSLARHPDRAHLLSPIDLQVVKACGVTFVESMVERVIEEKCAGDPTRAAEVRQSILRSLGGSLSGVEPGSERAQAIKSILIAEGIWSAYLEVGIGPDPEVFTKAPVLASVGWGARVGIPGFSSWNNPEPELVLIVNSAGVPVGATLGNDVNLRDVEGRSALLLGKAKDNNAQSSLGPFIRVFDEHYDLGEAGNEEIRLRVEGQDGFVMEGVNSVAQISRPLGDLVRATWGTHHQYPDGFALYTGTLFAPTTDRGVPGQGFTHQPGDLVSISSDNLGTLVNETWPTEELEPWVWGISQQMDYLLRQELGAQQSARI